MTTTLRDVVLAMRTGHAALVGENAGYLVLLAADAALVAPAVATREAVHLDEDGTVRLVGTTASALVSEMSLRRLLGDLLAELRSPAPNLERVAQRSDSRGLDTLVLELEAALVPVNRRAAKRSLARLFRETDRARKKYAADFAVAPRSPAPAAVQPTPARPASAPAPAAGASAPVVAAEIPVEIEVEVELDVPTNVLPALAVAPLDAQPIAPPRIDVIPPLAVTLPTTTRSSSPAMLDALARSGITKSPEPPQMRSPRAPVVASSPLRAAAATPSAPATPVEAAPAQAPWIAPEVPSLEPPAVEAATPFLGVRDAAPLLDEPEVAIDVESFSPAPVVALEASAEEEMWVEEEDVLTEIFAGTEDKLDEPVALEADAFEPVALESAPLEAVAESPAPEAVVAEAPPSLRRRRPLFPARWVPDDVVSEGEPLVESLPSEPRRPSDVGDLLDRMRAPTSSSPEIFSDLKRLSRVDLSPEAPPVIER